jgi:hypothetical protein
MKGLDTVNGIRRVDLRTRPPWKNNRNWLFVGRLAATKPGLAIWRKVAAPIEAPLMKATAGRVRLSFTTPVVVLVSTGARSGQRRETPLAYSTDGNDVVLIASNMAVPVTLVGFTTWSRRPSANCASESPVAGSSHTKRSRPTVTGSTGLPSTGSRKCSASTSSAAAPERFPVMRLTPEP